MDNMLYIIAGLVIILLVGVWVLRKNKAQQPPTSPRAQPISDDRKNTAFSAAHVNQAAPTQRAAGNATHGVTKFDNLTVAQRFMDQQRYDKAIEALERGLSEKPNDAQLSLKLLSVYALTNQKEDFYSTYATIKTHNDASTVEEAQQLKDLLEEAQASATFGTMTDTKTSMNLESDIPLYHSKNSTPTTDISDDDMSLDFDILSPSTEQESTSDSIASNSISSDDDDSDVFDLTLDDLETAELQQDTLDDNSTFALEDTPAVTATDADSNTKAAVLDLDNINDTNSFDDTNDDGFTLDFDMLLEDMSTDLKEEKQKNEPTPTLSDDDFILDFDNLAEDVDNEVHVATTPVSSESIDDDFTLFIDGDDNATVHTTTINAPTTDTQDSSQTLSLESDVSESSTNGTPTQLDGLVIGQEDVPTDSADFIDLNVGFDTDNNLDISNNETESTPTLDNDILTFDDDTGIDSFDFDIDVDSTDILPTILTPVIVESDNVNDGNDNVSFDSKYEETLPSADFTAQFASDFDFVKTLDNNQITLDLAGQYLQLGEYDSAKRLLNEVVAQGNSQQQQQAQELLTRTA